jgi:hypothetical protein
MPRWAWNKAPAESKRRFFELIRQQSQIRCVHKRRDWPTEILTRVRAVPDVREDFRLRARRGSELGQRERASGVAHHVGVPGKSCYHMAGQRRRASHVA